MKQTSFQKLKKLWEESPQGDVYGSFELWVWMWRMNGEWATFNSQETPRDVHVWLAHTCGFNTTAEVRYAINQLKQEDDLLEIPDDPYNREY